MTMGKQRGINFKKGNGLVPAIVQDANSGKVLMLGYMNETAYDQTIRSGLVTFFSRSRQKLWTKGETSGNYLQLVEIIPDCDGDTLLVKAVPTGPVCHTGEDTCFSEQNKPQQSFLAQLEAIIQQRLQEKPEGSYTVGLAQKGPAAIGRKITEEATEVLIAALQEGASRLIEESADLIYHLLVLLAQQGISLQQVEEALRQRHMASRSKR